MSDPLRNVQAALETIERVRETERLLSNPAALLDWALSLDASLAAGILAGFDEERARALPLDSLLALLEHEARVLREAAVLVIGRRRS